MVRPAAVILPCSSVLHDALQVQYGHGQESLEESVSSIASICMSSSFPPLTFELAPLMVVESDEEGSKKALKKTQLNFLSSQDKMYLNYIFGFT